MKRWAVFAALLTTLWGHGLEHEILQKEAVAVLFFYSDGTNFGYESYSIYPPDSTVPFQTGRLDALGRAVFLPDREGEWTVKTSSEDGHGATVTVTVGPQGVHADAGGTDWLRLVAGAGIIGVLFGFLWFVKRSAAQRGKDA